jgi:hypothetical protein
MPKERNKADDYRFLMTGTGVPQEERKGLKWIHKATFQGYQPVIADALALNYQREFPCRLLMTSNLL